jgi:hypothetical protein
VLLVTIFTAEYIAKTFNEPSREITKVQYNTVVKSLSSINWANIDDEEDASLISKIISTHLESTE